MVSISVSMDSGEKHNLTHESLHIPLIIYAPGVTRYGSSTDALTVTGQILYDRWDHPGEDVNVVNCQDYESTVRRLMIRKSME